MPFIDIYPGKVIYSKAEELNAIDIVRCQRRSSLIYSEMT